MELFSLSLEVKALKTVTNPDIKKAQRISMLGRLTPDMFSSDVTKKAYKRLQKLLEARSMLLDWEDLLEDPNLNVDYRDELRASDESPARGMKGFERLVEPLIQYRKLRTIMQVGRSIAKDLDGNEEDFDVDTYLLQIADKLNQAKGGSVKERVHSFGGKNSNALKLAKRVLNAPTEVLHKTGYKAYDDKNAGLPTTGVFIMGASTSGGKSVTSMNLAHRMAMANGIHCLKITLEMTEEQEMNRMLAMISGVDFRKIKQNKLTKKEKKAVYAAAKLYDKQLSKKSGARNSFVSPDRGMTIDDVLYMATAYNAEVTVLDYVGLLEGVDDGDQWKNLGGVVRRAKVHSQQTGRLIIILVQTDSDTGKIRYSQAMKEHADVVWTWNYSDPEIRETGVLPIQVIKARDGELFELPLKEMFSKMQVLDGDGEVKELSPEDNKSQFRKGGGKFKKREPTELADLKPNRRASMIVDNAYDDGNGKSKKKKRKAALE